MTFQDFKIPIPLMEKIVRNKTDGWMGSRQKSRERPTIRFEKDPNGIRQLKILTVMPINHVPVQM